MAAGCRRRRQAVGPGTIELGWPAPCSVRRRAERVIRRPGRRTAAGGSWWSSPLAQTMRCPAGDVVGRHLYRRAALAAKRPDGSTPHRLRSRMAPISAWQDGRQFEHLMKLIAVGGEEGQLGTGRGLHTVSRTGAASGSLWPRPHRRRRPSSKESASRHLRVSPR